MKAKPFKFIGGIYEPCNIEEATHVVIHMPGPVRQLMLPVIRKGSRDGTGCWTFTGDTETPTLKPSILHKSGHFANGFDPEKDSCWCKFNAEHPDDLPHFHCFICHVWVNDGKVQFLADCTHEFKGQTVDLLEVE